MTHSEEQLDDAASGFSIVSRRWSSWAGNLLATGIILIAGLTFGRQVIEWWGPDDQTSPDIAQHVVGPGGLGDANLLHMLEFGDQSKTLICKTISGDRNAALTVLRDESRKIARSAEFPSRSIKLAEARWLANTANAKPAEEEPGKWQVFVMDGPFPLAAAVRFSRDSTKSEDDQNVALPQRRVVSWSIALPSVDESQSNELRWTIYTCAAGGGADSNNGQFEINLPAGSTRTMSVSAETGGSVVGFKGTGRPGAWIEYFDQLASEKKWTKRGTWSNERGNWHQCFVDADAQTIHITIAEANDESMSGLVVFIPPSTDNKEN